MSMLGFQSTQWRIKINIANNIKQLFSDWSELMLRTIVFLTLNKDNEWMKNTLCE